MALPSHLAKKLRQALGPDAGGDLVTWLDETRAEHEKLISLIQALDKKLDGGFHAVHAKIDDRTAKLEVKIAETKADLMKWSLVFWVSAVGAIAALAGVLRQP